MAIVAWLQSNAHVDLSNRPRLLSTWIVQHDSQVGNRSSSAAKILLR